VKICGDFAGIDCVLVPRRAATMRISTARD
jgi:hypothetical protein